MDRTWSIEIDGKKHRIEVEYGRNANWTGKLLVDGNQVKTWQNLQLMDLPKEVAFEVEGKPVVLYAKGFFKPRMNLYFGGKLIKTV